MVQESSSSESLSDLIIYIQDIKSEGNALFQKGSKFIDDAIQKYQSGINELDDNHSSTTSTSIANIQKLSKFEKNQILFLRATLLSNMAMCTLKRAELGQNNDDKNDNDLKRTADLVTNAITLVDQIVFGAGTATMSGGNKDNNGMVVAPVTTKSMRSLRSKLLYRRAKSNFLLVKHGTSTNSGIGGGGDHLKLSKGELITLITNAQRDLQELISFDTKNIAAHSLLRQIKEYASEKLMSTGMISSTSDSPMGRALQNLRDEFNLDNETNSGNILHVPARDAERVITALKFIHATLLDDLTNGIHELLLNEARGTKLLVKLAFFSTMNDDSSVQMQSLALQSLSTASALPTYASVLQKILQEIESLDDIMFDMIVQSRTDEAGHDPLPFAEELANAVMSLQIRLMLYSHLVEDEMNYNRDDDESVATSTTTASSSPNNDKVKLSIVSDEHQRKVCREAIHSERESVKSMGLNLLSAWLEPNPLPILQSIQEQTTGNSTTSGNSSETISYTKKEPSAEEVRQMAPRELALYRKRCFQRSKGQKERSRSSAMYFCYSGGLDDFLSCAVSSATVMEKKGTNNRKQDGYWRREYVIAVGRIINHARAEEVKKGEEEGAIYIDENTENIVRKFFVEKEHQLTIEEISEDEVDENDMLVVPGINDEVQNCMKKCLFITSLLLANSEVGAWALKDLWSNAKNDWENLALSGNHRTMAIAAECASAAAGVEGARPWIHSCMDATNTAKAGAWRQLLSCGDREVRSGAASAMAKLGLADKSVSSDEGELFALLEVAAGLIEEEYDYDNDNNQDKIDATNQKFASKSVPSSTKHHQAPMERGVELLSYLSSKTTVKDEIAHGFALPSADSSSSKQSSVLNRLVDLADPSKKEAASPAIAFSLATIFASLSVSIETLRKEAFADKEITPEQYDQIQAMGKTEDEQKVEDSKRENDEPEEVRSRIKSMARHDVPRALVHLMEGASDATLEQTVLAMTRIADETSVRGIMIQQGCLSACIKMMKDGDLSEVEKKIMRYGQHAIAKILVTTNPSLLNTSQCMGAIKPLLQLVKDTESSDLQKFEALLSLTNLASHSDSTKQRIVSEKGINILSYAMFSNHELVRRAATEALSNLVPHPDMIDHLRQHEKLKVWIAFSGDFEDNFECSRAALGCLAMVTQDRTIALELAKASRSKGMIKEILECGNLELMHRLLVIILNLMEHGDECKELILSGGTVAFCEAYARSYQNGGAGVSELELAPSDRKLMGVTVQLAQEIVSMSS